MTTEGGRLISECRMNRDQVCSYARILQECKKWVKKKDRKWCKLQPYLQPPTCSATLSQALPEYSNDDSFVPSAPLHTVSQDMMHVTHLLRSSTHHLTRGSNSFRVLHCDHNTTEPPQRNTQFISSTTFIIIIIIFEYLTQYISNVGCSCEKNS